VSVDQKETLREAPQRERGGTPQPITCGIRKTASEEILLRETGYAITETEEKRDLKRREDKCRPSNSGKRVSQAREQKAVFPFEGKTAII